MDKGPSHLRLRPQQPIERDDVGDHQNRNIEYWDHIGGAQLPHYRRKSALDGVVIVKDEVDCPNEIESDDEQPEERTNSYGEKRQDGQHSGCEVAVGGECGKAGRQIGSDDTGKDKDKPEEAEAV